LSNLLFVKNIYRIVKTAAQRKLYRRFYDKIIELMVIYVI